MIELMIRQLNGPISAKDVIRGYHESKIARSETNDCVVRALAVVEDLDYDTAHRIVATKMGRRPYKGTPTRLGYRYFLNNPQKYQVVATCRLNQKDPKFVMNLMNGSYLKATNPDGSKCKMTVDRFTKACKKGRFFVFVRNHAFAVVDGKVIGNRDDSRRLRTVVLGAFRLKNN